MAPDDQPSHSQRPGLEEQQLPEDSPPKNWIKAAIPLSAIMKRGRSGRLRRKAGAYRGRTLIDLVDKLEA